MSLKPQSKESGIHLNTLYYATHLWLNISMHRTGVCVCVNILCMRVNVCICSYACVFFFELLSLSVDVNA